VASYPTFAQLHDSEEGFVDDLLVDRAVNGTVKVRALYTAPKRRWTLKHRLTTAQRDTLQAFYASYRTVTNTFVWAGNGTTYTFVFEGPPTYSYPAGLIVDAVVRIVEQ
jgi:hypothetical protein